MPSPILDYRGEKCFVCFCEDQTTKDLKYAIAEGFDSIELSKRYTTVTMGPCQGRLCHTNSIRVYAKTTGIDENTIGTTTSRPPYTPISMGVLAGRRRAAQAHLAPPPAQGPGRHHDVDGSLAQAALLRERRRRRGAARPQGARPDRRLDAREDHRHRSRAGAFLDRVYPNRFSDLKVGRTRYGVLTGDAGRIMDDGVVARIDDDTFYVSATSTGEDGVSVATWWNAVWFDGRAVRQHDGRARRDQRGGAMFSAVYWFSSCVPQ